MGEEDASVNDVDENGSQGTVSECCMLAASWKELAAWSGHKSWILRKIQESRSGSNFGSVLNFDLSGLGARLVCASHCVLRLWQNFGTALFGRQFTQASPPHSGS